MSSVALQDLVNCEKTFGSGKEFNESRVQKKQLMLVRSDNKVRNETLIRQRYSTIEEEPAEGKNNLKTESSFTFDDEGTEKEFELYEPYQRETYSLKSKHFRDETVPGTSSDFSSHACETKTLFYEEQSSICGRYNTSDKSNYQDDSDFKSTEDSKNQKERKVFTKYDFDCPLTTVRNPADDEAMKFLSLQKNFFKGEKDLERYSWKAIQTANESGFLATLIENLSYKIVQNGFIMAFNTLKRADKCQHPLSLLLGKVSQVKHLEDKCGIETVCTEDSTGRHTILEEGKEDFEFTEAHIKTTGSSSDQKRATMLSGYETGKNYSSPCLFQTDQIRTINYCNKRARRLRTRNSRGFEEIAGNITSSLENQKSRFQNFFGKDVILFTSGIVGVRKIEQRGTNGIKIHQRFHNRFSSKITDKPESAGRFTQAQDAAIKNSRGKKVKLRRMYSTVCRYSQSGSGGRSIRNFDNSMTANDVYEPGSYGNYKRVNLRRSFRAVKKSKISLNESCKNRTQFFTRAEHDYIRNLFYDTYKDALIAATSEARRTAGGEGRSYNQGKKCSSAMQGGQRFKSKNSNLNAGKERELMRHYSVVNDNTEKRSEVNVLKAAGSASQPQPSGENAKKWMNRTLAIRICNKNSEIKRKLNASKKGKKKRFRGLKFINDNVNRPRSNRKRKLPLPQRTKIVAQRKGEEMTRKQVKFDKIFFRFNIYQEV